MSATNRLRQIRSILGAALDTFTRYVPDVQPIVFDPVRTEHWRKVVDAADRIDGPAWLHYANDPDALTRIAIGHQRNITEDPANADWYRGQIAEITAHLDRRHRAAA